ncbi:MAG: hypothetical protein IPF90_13715 [Actinomycetales bacterium]|nr:hypothetical protein [Candidatus Phosphoribacter baldrii]
MRSPSLWIEIGLLFGSVLLGVMGVIAAGLLGLALKRAQQVGKAWSQDGAVWMLVVAGLVVGIMAVSSFAETKRTCDALKSEINLSAAIAGMLGQTQPVTKAQLDYFDKGCSRFPFG